MSKAKDADLILKLYDLRREETMRKARDWMIRFNPESMQDILDAVMGEHSAYFRMVTSYWEMAAALVAYRELQAALDRAMPDQIMQLDGKPFRKRGYWRAVAVAFDLRVELVHEDRGVDGAFDDGHQNFGWTVTYRASAPTAFNA